MREFKDAELRAFLQALDRHLDAPFRLDLIGEAVALLTLEAESGTIDIDVVIDVRPIEHAIQAAQEETGFAIPVNSVGVYDGPYHYEERVKRVPLKGAKKLQVYVPEKHDWALMKIVRLLGKDVEDILEVSETVGFNKKTFLKRFLNEMTHVIGRREDLVFNFLTMMSQLYGDEEADKMAQAIQEHQLWQ